MLVACCWSVSDQQPCSTCLSPALPAWVASCVRLQARSGGEAISVCCVFCVFHRCGRLHRPAALHQRPDVRLARGCAPHSVRSCVAHFYSTGDRCRRGNGGGGSTVHCSCNGLGISRTQTSTSRMLRERLVYGIPWCTRNRTYSDNYSKNSQAWIMPANWPRD